MSEFLLVLPALAIVAALLAWVQARAARNDIDSLRAELLARTENVRDEEEGVDQLRTALDELRHALEDTQRDLGRANAAIDGLTAAGEVIPAPTPPPLPRARSAGLDDLRRRLREAHSESSAGPEGEDEDETRPSDA